jgi:hypothetical protein
MKNCQTSTIYMVDENIYNLSPIDQIFFEHIQGELTCDDTEIDHLTPYLAVLPSPVRGKGWG